MPVVQSLGLMMLGGIFAWAGLDHFLKFEPLAASLAERGFPATRPLLAAGSLLELIAGAALALGIAVPMAAASLAVFTVLANLMVLQFWRYSGAQRDAMRNAFKVNIALIGGLIVIFANAT